MYQYTISQWIVFFFFYCFMGWIWECSFTIVKNRYKTRRWKWTNRGFLTGPVIPIYGFAAMAILIATIPVKDHVGYVFLFGALAATLIELVTGSTMERLFHVKYWDYSHLPLNYHGHICFSISVFWGCLSVVFIRELHPPVERLVQSCSLWMTEAIAFVCLGIFTYDFHKCLTEALDVKELLEKLHEANVVTSQIERYIGTPLALKPSVGYAKVQQSVKDKKELIFVHLEEARERRLWKLQQLREKLGALDSELLLDKKEEFLVQIEQQIKAMQNRTNRQYGRVRNHLKRNPGMTSGKYAEVMKEIKEMFKD